VPSEEAIKTRTMRGVFLFFIGTLCLGLYAQVFDDYDISSVPSSVGLGVGLRDSRVTSLNPAFVGGRRDTYLEYTDCLVGTESRIDCFLSQGVFTFQARGCTGRCLTIYEDESGSDISPRVNMLERGMDCWNIRLANGVAGTTYELKTTSPSSIQTSSIIFTLGSINTETDVCIPYDRTRGFDYQNVGVIQFGVVSSGQFNGFFRALWTCPQPAVSCWHIFTAEDGADINGLIVGDTITVEVHCENYKNFAEVTKTIAVSLPVEFGSYVPSTLSCSSRAISEEVDNRTIKFRAILTTQQTVDCQATFVVASDGIFSDVAAYITTERNSEFPSRSNEGFDLHDGSIRFCSPPTTSNFSIILPPTTSPPTTAPPTTTAPTTLPPTTEPPTTTPPTTEAPTPPPTNAPTLEPIPPTTEAPTEVPTEACYAQGDLRNCVGNNSFVFLNQNINFTVGVVATGTNISFGGKVRFEGSLTVDRETRMIVEDCIDINNTLIVHTEDLENDTTIDLIVNNNPNCVLVEPDNIFFPNQTECPWVIRRQLNILRMEYRACNTEESSDSDEILPIWAWGAIAAAIALLIIPLIAAVIVWQVLKAKDRKKMDEIEQNLEKENKFT